MTKLLPLLATSALIALTMPAKTETLARAGAWRVFSSVSPENNKPLCGMGTSSDDREILVKWFNGNRYLTLQVFKKGWRIPQQNTKLNVVLGFDGGQFNAGADLPAAGFSHAKAGSFVEVVIPGEKIADFLSEFKAANKMWIAFPSGNEATWSADMTGSRDMGNAFERCIEALVSLSQTQPHPRQSPTQPHGGGPTMRPQTVPYNPNDRGA